MAHMLFNILFQMNVHVKHIIELYKTYKVSIV